MSAQEARIAVRVTARTAVARDVVTLDLAPVDAAPLPAWTPGAHVDLEVRPGLERQYSLVATTADGHWRVAVLREQEGRGGSAAVHDVLVPGETVAVRGPRNHFAFDPARPAVFVAGGIGITPILPMIALAEADGTPWTLHYAGRDRAGMAFAGDLAAAHPAQVRLYPGDEGTRLDVPGLLAGPSDAVVYACGPRRLVDAVVAAGAHRGPDAVRVERFTAADDATAPGEPFEAELALSGITVTVPPDRSLLDVVEDAGVLVLSSCREGTCGTCETPVLEGEVEHRDTVLSAEEHAEGLTMMICVSRARGGCPRLVLDL
ncbi:PDR/VanB family oxidoreductase [Curtobacterium sp. MCBD17_028]|uniref:PDR/VanB family oxidoreductase n=1 Tax=Curtobacterium sp. MCBD17_028 TaxID=2175670 RepID=UPI000DAA9B64|nr:PDR/VanB family oxidoreductase [Curtobacterium sp. MCBD17_028]PZE28653.1 oxidoreductase [Curtobacterium sp. MCBD17_028]